MGARPLRRAIQRYIEDPLADEVLRQGPDSIISGTTVLVDAIEGVADDDEHPLSLKMVKPRKPRKKKDDEAKEPVGVGAKKADSDAPADDDAAPEAEAADQG